MAEIAQQLKIGVANEVGKLAEVTDKIKDAGLNILALCAWVEGDTGQLLMITDDNDKACESLSGVVESCEMQEVVRAVVPEEPGRLNTLAHKLADAGIDIHFAYATTAGGGNAMIVLGTADNAKAAGIL